MKSSSLSRTRFPIAAFEQDSLIALKKSLASNKKKALQALVKLNHLQTKSEKNLGVSLKANGRGFSSFDAPLLTSLASSLALRGTLSPKQMSALHRVLPRYAAQLLRISLPNKIAKMQG